MKHFKIPLHKPYINEADREAVLEAVRSGWVAPGGPFTKKFEEALKDFTGVPSAVALVSGTAALHLALKAAGVGEGDYVVVPTNTYVATVSPVLYQKAIPVFVDSERETLNMSPAYLEEALKDLQRKGIRPKAVIPVHLYGFPAQMDDIVEIAKRYGLTVIEDAAEAVGARYRQKPVGTFGDMGVFSFNGNKVITTSGGGALLLKDSSLEEKIRFWASHAKEDRPWFYHKDIGYNYQMSNILAALGWSQLKRLDEILRRKKEIYTLYNIYIQKTPCKLHRLPPDYAPNYWLNMAWCPPAKTKSIIKHMNEKGIEVRYLWYPLHKMPLFSDYPYYGNNESADFFEKGILLPSGLEMNREIIKEISENFMY